MLKILHMFPAQIVVFNNLGEVEPNNVYIAKICTDLEVLFDEEIPGSLVRELVDCSPEDFINILLKKWFVTEKEVNKLEGIRNTLNSYDNIEVNGNIWEKKWNRKPLSV